jgi:hypothetical protein
MAQTPGTSQASMTIELKILPSELEQVYCRPKRFRCQMLAFQPVITIARVGEPVQPFAL